MGSAIKVALLGIGKTILISLLTEKMIKKLVVILLRELAKKTDNKIDDEIVGEVEKALNA